MATPSLLEQVSEQTAIDNLHRIGDVGTTNELLLRRLLPHCTAEQLEHIETETTTKGRDLSSITDELWRKHYGQRFGEDHVDMVQERMTKGGRTFKWRRLYKAKMREQEELQTEGVDRLKELFQQQNAKKASRKIQAIDMNPPESRKRAKTTVLPISAGTSAGPASLSSKNPASSQVPPPVAGWTCKEQINKKAIQKKKKLLKKAEPEKGRLWKKSIRDLNKMKMLLKPAPLRRTAPVYSCVNNNGINQRLGPAKFRR